MSDAGPPVSPEVSMSEVTKVHDDHELAEQLGGLRKRFEEFRGRL